MFVREMVSVPGSPLPSSVRPSGLVWFGLVWFEPAKAAANPNPEPAVELVAQWLVVVGWLVVGGASAHEWAHWMLLPWPLVLLSSEWWLLCAFEEEEEELT